jgi:hypothetical protein
MFVYISHVPKDLPDHHIRSFFSSAKLKEQGVHWIIASWSKSDLADTLGSHRVLYNFYDGGCARASASENKRRKEEAKAKLDIQINSLSKEYGYFISCPL